MLLEKKNIFESDKKAIEEREAIAESVEEKRAIEKERWKIEEQRTNIEREIFEKVDQIKSLELQLKECELNSEKVMVREKDVTQEIEILKRNKEIILLNQAKAELEIEIKPLEEKMENIKRDLS